MLPDDKRRTGGAHGEGRRSSSEDEFGWIEEGAGRFGQAIQQQAGRDGEVEGMFDFRR